MNYTGVIIEESLENTTVLAMEKIISTRPKQARRKTKNKLFFLQSSKIKSGLLLINN
jgi:hypothetical protein